MSTPALSEDCEHDFGDACLKCVTDPVVREVLEGRARIGVLKRRVYELETAIGVMVPTIIRGFIDGLAPDADVDRRGAEAALKRVNAAMAPLRVSVPQEPT